jgi:tetratricopeptide (TPR) repeat protein
MRSTSCAACSAAEAARSIVPQSIARWTAPLCLRAALLAAAVCIAPPVAAQMPSPKEIEEAMREMQRAMDKLTPEQRRRIDEAFREMQSRPAPASKPQTAAPMSETAAQTVAPTARSMKALALSPRETVRGFYDEYPVDVQRSLRAFLERNRRLLGGQPTAVTPTAALATARRLLGRDPEAVLRRVRSLPGADSRPALNAHMLGLLLQRRPVEALAVALQAHALDARSPTAQFNVATLLYVLGRPNEALSLYDDLRARAAAPDGAGWASGELILEHARALALMATGRAGQARPLLERVVAQAPQLSEAALTLALLEDQDKRDPRRFFVAGQWRTGTPPMVCGGTYSAARATADALTSGEEVGLPFEDLFDMRRGSDGLLPSVPLPDAAWQPMAALLKLDERALREERELNALREKKQVLWSKVRKYTHQPFVAETREYRLFTTLSGPHYRDRRILQADLEVDRTRSAAHKSQHEHNFAAFGRMSQIKSQILADFGRLKNPPPYEVIRRKICAATRPVATEALAQQLPAVRAYDRAIRERFRLWHRYASALAGEIADPLWHQIFKLEIEAERRLNARALVLNARASVKGALTVDCETDLEARDVGAHDEAELPSCSDDDARHSAGIDIGTGAALADIGLPKSVARNTVIGVEINCRGVSLELNLPLVPLLLGVSAEVGIETNGEVTVFVGPKVAPGTPGAGGSVKSGAYVKVGADGLRDFGGKGEIKVSHTMGAGTSHSYKLDEMEFTLMPSPASPPPPAPAPKWLGTFPNRL